MVVDVHLNNPRKKEKTHNTPGRQEQQKNVNLVSTECFPSAWPFYMNCSCHCNVRQIQPIIADCKKSNSILCRAHCIRTITLKVPVSQKRYEIKWGAKNTKQNITQCQVQDPYGLCGEVFVETMSKNKTSIVGLTNNGMLEDKIITLIR